MSFLNKSLWSGLIFVLVFGCLGSDAFTRVVYESPAVKANEKRATLPVIRIGTTHIDFGPQVGWGMLQKNVWQLFIEKNLTYTIGGVTYGLQVISYLDDESDVNTSMALVDQLVRVDKVHVLITGYEGDTSIGFIPAAEAAGIPCLSPGAFELSFFPPGSLFWTINILPNINTLGYECAVPLVQAGARNFTVVTPNSTWVSPGDSAFLGLVVGALQLGGLNFTGPYLNVSDEAWVKPELLDPVIQQLAAANPDVAVFEFGQAHNIIFIDRMRQNNYNPNAYFVWGTGSYPEIRFNLTWEDAGSLISEAYQAALNASDPLWGTSLQYDALTRQRFNTPSANADANLAAALTILDQALRITPDLTPTSIRNSILAYNASTVVGPLSFTNNSVNRKLYCFQNDFPNATNILVVWPPDSDSYTQLIYPAPITYPSGYFSRIHPGSNDTTKWILIGFFTAFAAIVLLVALVLFIVWKKFHVIFIEKEESGAHEEWGTA